MQTEVAALSLNLLIYLSTGCRRGSGSSSAPEHSEDSQAEQSAASEESDDVSGNNDADDFQQATKRRSIKSAYHVDVSDSEDASGSTNSPPKRGGTRCPLRSNANRLNTAAPARRQPRRTATAKGSLAESPSNSSDIDSEQSVDEEFASDDNGEQQGNSRSKRRIRQDCKGDKADVKRQKALVTEDDSNDSMAEAGGSKQDAQVISDSEDQSDEESDKENQPSRRQTRFASRHCVHAHHITHISLTCMVSNNARQSQLAALFTCSYIVILL